MEHPSRFALAIVAGALATMALFTVLLPVWHPFATIILGA
jgi:hypothetical protein